MAAAYRASVAWSLREGEDFAAGRYSRGHVLNFEGRELAGTASAHVVGNKYAVPGAVDPEQMLVGSLSACHMLTFLHEARKAGFTVLRYRDDAVGVMDRNADGKLAVTKVTLRPQIAWAGDAPPRSMRDQLHHRAHEECFIANSVKTEVVVEEA